MGGPKTGTVSGAPNKSYIAPIPRGYVGHEGMGFGARGSVGEQLGPAGIRLGNTAIAAKPSTNQPAAAQPAAPVTPKAKYENVGGKAPWSL